ncbi:uncharacterized protein BHQ10_007534 [Talaromyces amestolkiae]|uniref:Uncharacterized protein n=1 Tax=Talaromyces amestolkiae TaxID=1196081 RepID=A0A364L6T8_TALAM|nr:uncharacterized protein BHQ10_007534 [Talaromyces amestolkiae]RAO71522.1 hypothetical protein BHQ10_007534 [Talaromyces amestolkiae]
MANKKEKKQAKDDRVQRRREKRAKRRESSSSDDDSTRSSTVNGTITDVTQWNTEIDHSLKGSINKIISLHDTFQNLSDVVGILSFIKPNAANAAEVFRPEIELKAENERLQHTLTQIQKAVEAQKLQELEKRCQELEDERVQLGQRQQELEQERQELNADRRAISIERQEMKKDLEIKKQEFQSEFTHQLEKEKKAHQKALRSSQDSENKLKGQNEKLKAERNEVETRAKDLGEGNETLMATNRALRSELDKEKSRFPIQSKGINYYREQFKKLNQKIEKLVYDFITGPMNDEQIRAVEADGLEEQEFFKFVPTRDSDVARYLWRRGAQACITMQLCDRLWKSYPCDSVQDVADPNGLRIVFDTFSQKYATVNPEKEAIWRIMTREILISFSTQRTSAQNLHKDIVCKQERETFCTQLQEVRQVRNMAVHRVTPQSSTIRKYGKIVQAIVGFLPRIGGQEFLQTYNERIRQFIETFWDIEKNESGDVNASLIPETIIIRGIESSPRNEQKEYNMKRSVEEQKLAAKTKANNVSQMARDFQESRRVKLMHVEQNQREKVDSELRKKEKSERLIKQLADAQLRKDERAERNRKQQDEAQIRRAERAARNRQQMEKAQLKKAGQ